MNYEDDLNYIKYFNIINSAKSIIKTSKLNILNINNSIKEIFQVFLNIMNDESFLVHLTSYKYNNTFNNYINNIIELESIMKLFKDKKIKILDSDITTSLINLNETNEYS
jgi:hypothetical protein